MGGSMDLVSNPDETTVIVATDHTDKYGKSKIKQKCTLPLTGAGVVSRIITSVSLPFSSFLFLSPLLLWSITDI
jgi:3-oxoacid CoA-transferase